MSCTKLITLVAANSIGGGGEQALCHLQSAFTYRCISIIIVKVKMLNVITWLAALSIHC